MKRFLLRWGPVLGWAAVVFFVSAQHRLPQLPGVLAWDKLQHSTGFVLGGLLLARALEGTRGAALLAFVVGLAYAATDELHQLFVPGRHADVRDWVADAIGIAAGIAAWRLYIFLVERRARRRAPAREGAAAVNRA